MSGGWLRAFGRGEASDELDGPTQFTLHLEDKKYPEPIRFEDVTFFLDVWRRGATALTDAAALPQDGLVDASATANGPTQILIELGRCSTVAIEIFEEIIINRWWPHFGRKHLDSHPGGSVNTRLTRS